MPRADQLPEALAPLTRRQGIELDDAGWQDDVARLIRRLEGSGSERGPRRRLVALALALVALAGGAAALTLRSDDPEQQQTAREPERGGEGLLANIPAGTRPACQPASSREPTADTSLVCDVGGSLSTSYHRFPDAAVADAWYRQVRAAEDVRPGTGDCTPADFAGEGSYEDGSYFCILDPERPPEVFAIDRRSNVGLRAVAWNRGERAAGKLLDLWECCIRPVAGGA
jgi:hypothetical protein